MNRSRVLSKVPRRTLMALLCMAAAGGVFAQDDVPRPRTPTPETPPPAERAPGMPGAETGVPPLVAGPVKPVNLACCRCLGETLGPINISTGQPVPWTVNSGTAVLQTVVPGWHGWNNPPPMPPGAKWIGPANGNAAAPGPYTYELKINVQRCVIPGSMTINGNFWADNEGTVSLSGLNAPTATHTTLNYPQGFQTQNGANFSYTVPNASGVYILKVTTRNQSGPTGLLLAASLLKRCVTETAGPGVSDLPANSTK